MKLKRQFEHRSYRILAIFIPLKPKKNLLTKEIIIFTITAILKCDLTTCE